MPTPAPAGGVGNRRVAAPHTVGWPGGLGWWAAVYTTIGMAILSAWLTGPTGRLICLLMLTALALVVVIRRSRVMRAGRGSGRRESV